RVLARRRRRPLPGHLHREQDRRAKPIRDDRRAGSGGAREEGGRGWSSGEERSAARSLRRAWRRARQRPLLPRDRARLRELLALPRPDRACRGGPRGPEKPLGPLRVVVVAEYYPRPSHPGWGIWAHRQALAVREHGVDVRVLALARPLPPLHALRALGLRGGRPD